MTFDVTIPVLNEEVTLAENVGILRDFLKSNFPTPKQWRIVIADNGSEDRTPAIGKSLAAQWEEVQYLQIRRRGVGLALKTSWGQSQADMVGYMDLDLATDLAHFLEAYRAIAEQGMDLVYGTRLHKHSQVIGRSLKREVASRGFNWKPTWVRASRMACVVLNSCVETFSQNCRLWELITTDGFFPPSY